MIYNTKALKKLMAAKRKSPDKSDDQKPLNGVKLVNNMLYVYKEGMVHNEHGPAILSMNRDGKILFAHYYFNDRKLPCDDIVVKMIKRRDIKDGA